MSWHLGPLVGFDLETTGVDPETARIVTACVVLIDGSGQSEPDVTTWLVNPGVEIPEAATAIHGITTEHAAEHGRAVEHALAEIAVALFSARGPIVAFNACYDLTVLDRELRRHKVAVHLPERLTVVDPFVVDKHVDRFRRGSRKLADQCTHYGVRLDGAHDASHDAIAACRVAWRIAQRHPEIGAMSLPDLHALQVAAKREQDASFAEYRRSRGESVDGIDGAWPLRPFAAAVVDGGGR